MSHDKKQSTGFASYVNVWD